ncbi:cation diffusion facilitator family transporter [Intestinibacter bartlettii]|uniref:Cation diffusion facilitator family transporter n=1 Tax=Intestinibacter bartlettii TaxID=261299 RepID=A0ABS6DYH4_9FIRM|nr:cation diffusion facilitator family transporter [Intestinibacter bartlettii]MBU5336892.1 cation diffusion facilitator family transporter [Intestinibacter bartlettii]MDO5011637.1 cation diffusion facilitator family transporter [Intestinibacter bartlettii]
MDAYKKVKNVLLLILVANLAVTIMKLIVGSYIQSTSVLADGFHSFSDSASNIVGIIGISIAQRPKDKRHPYGHTKFEVLSSLFIGIMMVFIALKIVTEAILKIKDPESLNMTNVSFVILIITLIINIVVSKYEYSVGKKMNSYILISDSLHTRSDVYVSIGVLVTLICIKLGFPPVIDKVVSFVVGIFILHGAYEIFKSTIKILVDGAVIEENKIKEIVKEFNEIKEIKNIRSRGSQNDIHVDIDILVEPDMTVEKSHELSHKIENTMREKINRNIQVTTHIEPFYK